jgi:hypothetical protein
MEPTRRRVETKTRAAAALMVLLKEARRKSPTGLQRPLLDVSAGALYFQPFCYSVPISARVLSIPEGLAWRNRFAPSH